MREGLAADLSEAIGRDFASGGGFQDLRCDVRARSDLAAGDAFVDFVEDRAQKRGRFRIEHQMPRGGKTPS